MFCVGRTYTLFVSVDRNELMQQVHRFKNTYTVLTLTGNTRTYLNEKLML